MISFVMAVRIRDKDFEKLWLLTLESIQGILKTVEEQFELIVIDNGSHSDRYITDLHRVSALWGEMHPNMEGFRALRFDEHVSLPKAWNEGINQSDGDWIAIINNDIIYHEKGWVTRMIDTFKTKDNVGIVGIQHMSWAYFSFVEGSLFMFPGSFKEEFNLNDEDDAIKVFDEQFMYICDVDFNRRVQDAGYVTMQVDNPPLQPMSLQHLGHRTINTLAHHTDFVAITHEDRVKLCVKYGYDPLIND